MVGASSRSERSENRALTGHCRVCDAQAFNACPVEGAFEQRPEVCYELADQIKPLLVELQRAAFLTGKRNTVTLDGPGVVETQLQGMILHAVLTRSRLFERTGLRRNSSRIRRFR